MPVDAPRQGIEQLSRVLEVALPKQRGSLASQAKGCVSGNVIVGDAHARGDRRSPFRAPAGGAGLTCLRPTHHESFGHDNALGAMLHISERCVRNLFDMDAAVVLV
jgi:hypothetical protein